MVNPTNENKKCRIIVHRIPLLYSSWLCRLCLSIYYPWCTFIYIFLLHQIILFISSTKSNTESYTFPSMWNYIYKRRMMAWAKIMQYDSYKTSCLLLEFFLYILFWLLQYCVALWMAVILWKSTLREMNSLDSMVLGNIGHPLISRKCV